MRLTEQQLSFFDTFGFLMFRGLFAKEIDSITDSFEGLWASHGGGHQGKAHDFKERSSIVPFIDRDEYLSALIDDPSIEGILSSVLGDDFNYAGSDGNFYVGDTEWHSDGWRHRGYVSVKMAFYLDPVTRDTGCLRVIPGSHRMDDTFGIKLEDQIPESLEQWGVDGRDVPAVALESEPGDLLMFNHRIKHSSFGGGDRRRMFTINCEQRYREEDLPELRDEIARRARYWLERNYGEKMVATAGPGCMRHLEQRMANDGHLAELSRKARQEMDEPSRH